MKRDICCAAYAMSGLLLLHKRNRQPSNWRNGRLQISCCTSTTSSAVLFFRSIWSVHRFFDGLGPYIWRKASEVEHSKHTEPENFRTLISIHGCELILM